MGTQVSLAGARSYPPRQVLLRQKSPVVATKLVRKTTKLSLERGVRCKRLQYEREQTQCTVPPHGNAGGLRVWYFRNDDCPVCVDLDRMVKQSFTLPT